MISVVIRTKNQANALSFLLKNLRVRYAGDIDEVVVIDNLSTDHTATVCEQFDARLVTIENFSYGSSANLAAQEASHDIVVIFSAHSYPVSHDFFKVIAQRFKEKPGLAGLRCLHSTNDYRAYINEIQAKDDPNRAGLIFSGSAFAKAVWKEHPFRDDVATFEDKEWSKRVLEAGYDIEFVPAIFHYEINRNKKQLFFRFKNDVIGNYQLWHEEVTVKSAFNGLIASLWRIVKGAFIDMYYACKRFFYIIKFLNNKPKKF
ncbi:glycosyl transferase family 2 [Nonlabens dokdonensis]|uniref:Glycosyl transferase family 2 n=1 Tax=Nonlabens dokdonensis TaxID=328515 RepID=A0A1Z8B7Z9_9FLAO|nr:glycosyltransferase [Nonlabens dokdonensis]OUS18683.1 glycosyl transferase family 2 [Nonlabens dokdonensis]